MSKLFQQMQAAGFAFLEAATMRKDLLRHGTLNDWTAFAGSWNALDLDTYMADGGRYRRRRHAVFAAKAGEAAILRQPDQPHYQDLDYNALNGGIARWFEPMNRAVAQSESLGTILAFCRDLFDGLLPNQTWHIELHQFRIEAHPDAEGRPTPEGMHRDGVDYVLVLMIDRINIASGVTTIHDLERRQLGSFTLTQPLDAALVHDWRVYHGVTPVEPLDVTQPAHRDVLVVTFRGNHPA
jgi:hypothetical protein